MKWPTKRKFWKTKTIVCFVNRREFWSMRLFLFKFHGHLRKFESKVWQFGFFLIWDLHCLCGRKIIHRYFFIHNANVWFGLFTSREVARWTGLWASFKLWYLFKFVRSTRSFFHLRFMHSNFNHGLLDVSDLLLSNNNYVLWFTICHIHIRQSIICSGDAG